jgi:putative FmdB family regulatory protein
VPIYEYLCQDCAYTFEVKQSIKDEPVAVCARCGKSAARIISAPAIMFKGSGWYVTDYSDKLKPPAGDSNAPASEGKKDTTAAPTAAASGAPAPASSGGGTGTTSSSSTSSSSGNTSGST